MIIKAQRQHAQAVVQAIKEKHSYEVPEVKLYPNFSKVRPSEFKSGEGSLKQSRYEVRLG